jgi:hypothetical protein
VLIVRYRACVEAVLRANPAAIGISLNPLTDGRVFRPPFPSRAATALMDRYLHLGFHRFLFGIETHFGDR